MIFTKQLLTLAQRCAEKYPSDDDRAEKEFFESFKRSKEFPELAEQLIRSKLRELIQDQHKSTNELLFKANGVVENLHEFRPSTLSRLADLTVYDLRIDGRRLGDIYGRECRALAKAAFNRSATEFQIGKLLAELADIAKPNSPISRSVSEAQIKAILGRSKRKRKPRLRIRKGKAA